MIKLVVQLGLNAGERGFKRADALEVLENSLPANMSKTQKLDHVSNMLRGMMSEELLEKIQNGRGWKLSSKGLLDIKG